MNFWQKLIAKLYLFLAFATPLIFTPYNWELFEFNKMILVYLVGGAVAAAWLAQMISERRLIFRRSFWDFPLLLFLLSQVAATIISIDRHTSFWGWYSRFHGGLASTLCYLVLYWGAVTYLQPKDLVGILVAGLTSGSLVALWGVAEHFGIDKNWWVQDVQMRVFSTLGQPNWLAAYLDILLFLTLAFWLLNVTQSRVRSISLFLFALFYLTLLYTKSRSGFLGFVLPLPIFIFSCWKLIKVKTKECLAKIAVTLTILLICSLWEGTPFTHWRRLPGRTPIPSSNQQATPKTETKITPSFQIRKIVWQGALKLWQQYPLFGTGLETFGYTYWWVRPSQHNATSEWDFLYNKAHNEFLNFAATSGTFGLAAYLWLSATYFFFLWRHRGKNPLFSFFFCAHLSLLLTNFFGFSVVVTALAFFLLPAFAFVFSQSSQSFWQSTKPTRLSLAVFTFLVLANSWYFLRWWLADYYFVQGVKLRKKGDFQASLVFLNRAITLRSEPLYLSHRALSWAKLATIVSSQKKPEITAALVQNAIGDAQTALARAPFHLNFYKNQARVLYYLSAINPNYLKSALETLIAASKLAPTDPKIPYNIGLLYQALGEPEKAKSYLQKALRLKPDYQLAKHALAQLASNSSLPK